MSWIGIDQTCPQSLSPDKRRSWPHYNPHSPSGVQHTQRGKGGRRDRSIESGRKRGEMQDKGTWMCERRESMKAAAGGDFACEICQQGVTKRRLIARRKSMCILNRVA